MISCGGWHTLALKTDGSVWSHGSNFWGQLGIVNNREEQNVFTEVKSLDDKEVSQIYCGAVNSLALTITGRLYHWGAFDFETFNIDTPKELFLDFKIRSITAGYQDFMVLDLEGRPFHCYYEADRKLHCDLVFEDTPVRTITYPNVYADRTASYCFQLQESDYIVIWNKAGEEGKLIKTMLKSAVDACALYANISTTSQLTILSSSAIDNDDGFNDSRNSNFIIKQGQKRIYLNKTIASEKSKFLAELFEGDWNGRRFIRLNDYPFVVWFTFLRYVYTGKLHCLLQPEWACLLLALALESELDALQQECFEYILGHQEELRQVFQTDPKQARYLARFVHSGKIQDLKSVNLDKNLFCK